MADSLLLKAVRYQLLDPPVMPGLLSKSSAEPPTIMALTHFTPMGIPSVPISHN
jgi:hypothetical protein